MLGEYEAAVYSNRTLERGYYITTNTHNKNNSLALKCCE